MAYPVTLNGRTYTLADFEGTNYVDGLPDAFEDFVTHAGDIYNDTSTSSVAIGTGSKTFTVSSAKPYQAGTPLRIADAADPSTNFMDTVVTSYSGTTLVVNSIGYGGSGTKTSWTINIGGAKTVDGTLGLSQGGTGATTASDARTNIDVYSKSEADSRYLNVSGEASDVVLSGDLTVDTDTLFVDSSLNSVNIGTTTGVSGYPLRVANNSGNSQVLITAGTNFNSTIAFGDQDANDTGQIVYASNGDSMRFHTNGSERVRIDSSGSVLYQTAGGQGFAFGASGSSASAAANMYAPASQTLAFGTNSSERMRIKNTGEVVIGGTSTSYGKLHIFDGNSDIDMDTNASGQFHIDGNAYGFGIALNTDGAQLYTNSSARFLIFGTDETEACRVDGSQNFLVGTTTGGGTIGTYDGFGAYSGGTMFSAATSARSIFSRRSTDGDVIEFRKNSTDVGSISVTGSATAYNTSSDYRLKENVTAIVNATERLKQLNPVRFNFIADPDKTVDGFLAHEVSDHVPEAVKGEKDAVDADGNPEYQGIDQSKLVPLLVATIKELEARITALES